MTTNTKKNKKILINSTTKKRKKKGPLIIPEKYKIHHYNILLLKFFITKTGKIRSRRISRLFLKQQNLVKKAIKRARSSGLIPSSIDTKD